MKIWAYLNKDNILCCALLKESVPEGIKAIEFEVESPDDVIYDGTQIRLKTEEEKLAKIKEKIDNERKGKVANLLSQTDYVIIKLQETKVLGDETKYQELLEQYNSILEQRKQIRAWNDDVEKRIQEATTREELEEIRQEITNYNPE